MAMGEGVAKVSKIKSDHRSISPVIFIVAVLLGAVFSPSALIVVIGMLPTLAAFVIDQDRNRSATITVGVMNLAGVIPQLIKLWQSGQTFDHSVELIRHPFIWVEMYCAAAIGWFIYYSVTSIIHLILVQRAKMRIADLEARQNALMRQWGEEIKTRPNAP